MSTPLDVSSPAAAVDANSSPPIGADAPPTIPRDLFTLLNNALTHYPVIQLLATHLHDADLVNLMLTSRAIYHTIAPSRAAIKTFTCGGVNRWRFGCWCCGTQVCHVCLTSPCPPTQLPPLTRSGAHSIAATTSSSPGSPALASTGLPKTINYTTINPYETQHVTMSLRMQKSVVWSAGRPNRRGGLGKNTGRERGGMDYFFR